jgi:site-specific recombinase XerD
MSPFRPSTKGNWLTAEQSQRLWQAPGGERLKEKRDRALLAVLLACGLRRYEAVELNLGHIQQREEHRAIVDLKGKAGHTPARSQCRDG